MININGKEWTQLTSADIEALLSNQGLDESFYFEFKDDRIAPFRVAEEISAFSNTFGGYIFLGVSDAGNIDGCTEWNEQRIHTTIYDSITPTPSFDVKRMLCNGKTVFVIKIDEGTEPPYITNKGKIYERISSGSFPIKDSVRLSQIYNKREHLLSKMESKVTIPPITANVDNIYGYIDLGFVVILTDVQEAWNAFNAADLKKIANEKENIDGFNITHIGESILYTPGGLSVKNGFLPAHTNNFVEIMADGSARMRLLLSNNDAKETVINTIYATTFIRLFKEIYSKIFGEMFPNMFVYAKKYEALTVLKQFHPSFFFDEGILKAHPDWEDQNRKIISSIKQHQEIMGVDTIVTNDRIPKTGLYTIDKRNMQKWGLSFSAESILGELFYSQYVGMGFIPASNASSTQVEE